MTAPELLSELSRRGYHARAADDGRISVRPPGVPPDLRREISQNRADILALLVREPCAFFWGHSPAGNCARCTRPYREHLAVAGIVLPGARRVAVPPAGPSWAR